MMVVVVNTFVLAVALMIGATTAQTGTFSFTSYSDAECATQFDPPLPTETSEWTSGECATCSGEVGECTYPFFNTGDDSYAALVANGADPAYAKVTCANGVVTVEHFSDAECTNANKVSPDDINNAHAILVGGPPPPPEDAAASCTHLDVNLLSGVNIQGSHCDGMYVTSSDVVRLASPAVRTHIVSSEV